MQKHVIKLKYSIRTIIIKWKFKIKKSNRCNKVKILCSYYYNKVKG